MQTLSRRPGTGFLNFEELLHKIDAEYAALTPTMVERFCFDIDGMTYEIRRMTHDNGYRFLITVIVCYLPFTLESAEQRTAIRSIVSATQRLPTVRFSITPASKITAGGMFEIADLVAPDFVFYPLILFIQEAKPFIDLIGKYNKLLSSQPGVAAKTVA